jgi:hypothetical protein
LGIGKGETHKRSDEKVNRKKHLGEVSIGVDGEKADFEKS